LENKLVNIRRKIFSLRRKAGFLPYQRIFKRLKKNIPDLDSWNALDLFAGDGNQSTIDMKKYLTDIELWDNNPKFKKDLEMKFPLSEIKITDSYKEVFNIDKLYNLILLDCFPRYFDGHCEHFDFFPRVFELMKDEGVLVIMTMPLINKKHLFNTEHMELRKKFYNTENPFSISLNHLVETYKKIANKNNFKIKNYFFQDRWFLYNLTKWFRAKRLGFLVLHLEKF